MVEIILELLIFIQKKLYESNTNISNYSIKIHLYINFQLNMINNLFYFKSSNLKK